MQEKILNKKIKIPKNTKVSFENLNNIILISGLYGESEIKINSNIEITINSDFITISSKENKKEFKKYLGLYNSLIKSQLKGISQKFKVNLFLNGIGFKVNKVENQLIFKLGYSHDIILEIPSDINVSLLKSTQIILYSSDWGKLTQFAHIIKKLKEVEPYKGKGILLKNETVLRKEGKKNKK